jgi:Photosynthesis system II assembly factor YCF48
MKHRSRQIGLNILSLVGILLFVTLVVRHTGAATLSPVEHSAQLAGSWTKVEDPGWSGDSHSWISATDGWGFSPQPPSGIEFYRWDGSEWSLAQTLDKDGLSYLYGIDIQMLSANDGWAVAPSLNEHYSTFFHWDGADWNSDQTITDTDISAIDVFKSNEGWAVGISTCCGANYYHWNGSTWQKQGYTDLHWANSDISMVSASDGWSVGNGIARINGGSWEKADSPTAKSLNGIDMISSDDGWIVGNEGTILHWDGSGEWMDVPSPTTDNLWDIDMVSSDNGWAVGDSGVILHWDGNNWSSIASPTTADLREIDMTSAADGWIPYYDDSTSSPGLLHYAAVSPSLTINYENGSPGSFFTVEGQGFPAESSASIKTNGAEIGNIDTDESGDLVFLLDTAQADLGSYIVTVEVNPIATIGFTLSQDAPLREQEGSATILEIPAGVGFSNFVSLPVILGQ